jgi:hypothetical protein
VWLDHQMQVWGERHAPPPPPETPGELGGAMHVRLGPHTLVDMRIYVV